MWYQGGGVALRGFADLAGLLEQVQRDPAWFVVRGALRTSEPTFRRTHVDKPGEAASLAPAAHRWVLLDLDKYREDVPSAAFAADPASWAKAARSGLPECFRGATCWWQATGSAGIKPGVRLRLAFWLSRAVADAEWKTWVDQWSLPVDDSLFTPSQPHFTAWPIFDGVADPVALRSGVLEGLPEVTIPDLSNPERLLGAEDELVKAARRMRKAPQGERHNTLNRVTYHLASRFGEDTLPARRIEAAMFEAAFPDSTPDQGACRTVEEAIRHGRERGQAARDGWRSDLAMQEDGITPRSTAANVSLYMTHHTALAGRLAFDERAQRPVWMSAPPWGGETPRAVTEADEVHAVEWFQGQAHMDAKAAWVRSAILKASQARPFDPIRQYLDRVPTWDGKDRVDTFFIRHLGVEDTALHRAQARCWFIQAVRRAHARPDAPVQADYMIILSGKQGLRKSSTLEALCPLPRFFRSNLPELGSKDSLAAIADAWIVELSELTHRKADRDTVKAFITARMDKFRPAYGRNEVEIPRRAVLIGTTNEGEFLTDPTGNRRFWPMSCTWRADVTAVLAERDALWGEALARAAAGEQAYLSDAQEAQVEADQEDYREEDPFAVLLEDALRKPYVTTAFGGSRLGTDQLTDTKHVRQILSLQAAELAGVDPRNPQNLRKVKDALRSLGWKERRFSKHGGRCWTPPGGWEYSCKTSHAETN